MGRLPEAWIAPPATRELRELVRHRAKLVGIRSNCKAQIHAVLAKCGIQVSMTDLFGLGRHRRTCWTGSSCPSRWPGRLSTVWSYCQKAPDDVAPCSHPQRTGLAGVSALRDVPATPRLTEP